jgi:hypothetical protein
MKQWKVYKKNNDGTIKDLTILKTNNVCSQGMAWHAAARKYCKYPWKIEKFSLHVVELT